MREFDLYAILETEHYRDNVNIHGAQNYTKDKSGEGIPNTDYRDSWKSWYLEIVFGEIT